MMNNYLLWKVFRQKQMYTEVINFYLCLIRRFLNSTHDKSHKKKKLFLRFCNLAKLMASTSCARFAAVGVQ